MHSILFYEKPGCMTNRKQKSLLREAGYELDVRDLLATEWTAEALLAFLGNRPVADWFNRAAPAVKSGEVLPEALDAAQALALLLEQHLLIRRPLIQFGDARLVGFDAAALDALLPNGFKPAGTPQEGCSHGEHAHGASCKAEA